MVKIVFNGCLFRRMSKGNHAPLTNFAPTRPLKKYKSVSKATAKIDLVPLKSESKKPDACLY